MCHMNPKSKMSAVGQTFRCKQCTIEKTSSSVRSFKEITVRLDNLRISFAVVSRQHKSKPHSLQNVLFVAAMFESSNLLCKLCLHLHFNYVSSVY